MHKVARIVHKNAESVNAFFGFSCTPWLYPMGMTLETIEVETAPKPNAAVIWLHGLGADGHDFEPVVPQLVRRGERAWRFIFPHAPVRPVTLNGGMSMRAWYDIVRLDRTATEDAAGFRDSDALIRQLIAKEAARGISASRVVLAGFSQGGALTLYTALRYPERLAGAMALSCYLPLARACRPIALRRMTACRFSWHTGYPTRCCRSPWGCSRGISCGAWGTRSNGINTRCRTRCARRKSPTSANFCTACCRSAIIIVALS